MRSECLEKVNAHLVSINKKPLTPQQGNAMGDEILKERQRWRKYDPAGYAALSKPEQAVEAAKRVIGNKMREARQAAIGKLAAEQAAIQAMNTVRENASRYTGAGTHGRGLIDFLEGVDTQKRGAEIRANADGAAALDAAMQAATKAGGGDTSAGSFLLFGSRKSDPVFEDVVRSVMGEGRSDGTPMLPGAAEYAGAWSASKERDREFMNRHGGNIGHLDHFMEAMHNPRVMQLVGQDKWIEYWMQNGDWSKMQHPSGEAWGITTKGTDIAANADAEKRDFLFNSYRSLIEDGVNKTIMEQGVAPTAGGGRGANLTKSAGHRVLFLKDAQAIIGYNKQFNDRSLGSVFHESLERTAGDASLVSSLGPNPRSTFEKLAATAKKLDGDEAAPKGNKGDYEIQKSGWTQGAYRWARNPEQYFDVLSGPQHQPGKIDTFFTGYTAYKAATALTSTAVRAPFQDFLPMVQHALHVGGYQGMQIVHGGLRDFMTGLHAARGGAKGAEARAELQRFGIALDYAANQGREFNMRMTVQNKTFLGTPRLLIGNVMNRAAQATMKYTLLNRWTNINRNFGQTASALGLANMVKKDWAQLSRSDTAMLVRAGINESDWPHMQQMPMGEVRDGASMIDIKAIDAHPAFAGLSVDERFALSNKVSGFVRGGGDITTSEHNFQAKAVSGALGQTGTAKQLMLFKNAALTQSVNLARRMEERSTAGRWGYAATTAGATMMLGYAATAVTALTKGQDVPDPTDPLTMVKSLMTGGGLAMGADLVNSVLDLTGDSGHSSSAVPVISDIQSLTTIGTKLFAGEPDDAAYRAIRLARQQLPLTNYWYAKVAVDHMLFNKAAAAFNPNYIRRMNGYAQKSGTPYWWKPEEALPGEFPGVGERRK